MNLAMSSPAPWSGVPSQENQPFKKTPASTGDRHRDSPSDGPMIGWPCSLAHRTNRWFPTPLPSASGIPLKRPVFRHTPPDKGRYFICDSLLVNVSSFGRSGLLRYRISPQSLLSGPFHHSGVGRNQDMAGPVRSYSLAFTYPCQPHPPSTEVEPVIWTGSGAS